MYVHTSIWQSRICNKLKLKNEKKNYISEWPLQPLHNAQSMGKVDQSLERKLIIGFEKKKKTYWAFGVNSFSSYQQRQHIKKTIRLNEFL